VARPKNIAGRDRVASAARRLFLTRGYTETSYAEIANACGCTRSLVQLYFPKKQLLAIDFFDKLLTAAIDYLTEHNMRTGNDFADMYVIGQLHFWFLLTDDNLRRFTLDILASRALTEEVLAFDAQWGFNFVAADPAVRESRLTGDTVMAMGGFYELLYQSLRHGHDLDDMPYWLRKVMVEFMIGFGHRHEDAVALLQAHEVDADQGAQIAVALRERLFPE